MHQSHNLYWNIKLLLRIFNPSVKIVLIAFFTVFGIMGYTFSFNDLSEFFI